MVKSTGSYPRVHVDTAPVAAVGQAGGILLVETIRAAGEEAGRGPEAPDALLCGDGEIGVAVRRSLDAVGLTRILVVSPDDFPEARALSIPVYRQDFEALAAKSYQCLQRQNRPGWVAETYRVRGELIV